MGGVADIWPVLIDAAKTDIGKMVIGGLIGGSYSIWQEWRKTGYRMLDRIDAFLKSQEKRLLGTREHLSELVQIPSPATTRESPIFSLSKLNNVLGKMNWGYGTAAMNDLQGAIQVCIDQSAVSERISDEHKQRQVLACLLLGARSAAAAPTFNSPAEKAASYEKALGYFKDALNVFPNKPDCDALEYAGLILLHLMNAEEALDYFNRLVAARLPEGGPNLARAYRLQAAAQESLAEPSYWNANIALNSALGLMSSAPPLERALTFEHQGQVRLKLQTPNMLVAAESSFADAKKIFDAIKGTPDGRRGLARIRLAERALAQRDPAAIAAHIVDSDYTKDERSLLAKLVELVGQHIRDNRQPHSP